MSRFCRSVVIGLAGALIAATQAAIPAAAQEVERAITRVAGDVYRFQNRFHYSLVTVTETGVVVVDPINAEAATWLKANLGQITDKPITHLIYSHSHGDHASGGAALAARTVIAQANAPARIDGVAPTHRFAESETIAVGGKSFELTWLGPGHGEDLIAVVVRPENVAFITDVASPERLPYRDMPSSSIDDWIDQIRKVETLDFEIFAPAHGRLGVKADAAAARRYMETLRAEVLAGLQAGRSPEELAGTVLMEDYKGWAQYDAWRALNVRGMADYLISSGKAQ